MNDEQPIDPMDNDEAYGDDEGSSARPSEPTAEMFGEDAPGEDVSGEELVFEDGVAGGLADTGLADTGLAGTGLADTGLADTGLAGTGLAGEQAAEAVDAEYEQDEKFGDIEEHAPELFRGFLDSLATDTRALMSSLTQDRLPDPIRRRLIGGLNYLFKSLDLIDDGIEGLGFLEDAFVLRLCVARARSLGALPDELMVLARQAPAIRQFLGDLTPRFEAFVASLDEGVVRGRSVQAIFEDSAVRDELLADLEGWISRYHPPQFVLDAHGLVKLRSFLNAKLPR